MILQKPIEIKDKSLIHTEIPHIGHNHRINLTLYKLEQFLDGDIDEAVDGLIAADQAAKMKDFG